MDRSFNPGPMATFLLATSFFLPSGAAFFGVDARAAALCVLACQGVGIALLARRPLPCLAVMAALFYPAWHWPATAMTVDHVIAYECAVMIPFVLFARSLQKGHEPLASALARQVHGTLRPDVARYTLALTWFWTGFLALALLAPPILWLVGPAGSWRWPASGAVLVLTCVLAGLEYGLRRIVIRDFHHASPLAAIKAFRNHPSSPQACPDRHRAP
ncbi:hypothetical protein K2X14_06465 [Acetobacter sp. TBRC 12305]|uniref:Uncharacterized protein n=1 Tax=Acetobacter garciniae TaxID=2817435 RepID=A0A939KMP8_9PROT|nr:hypothetical protein [Acetobacter garciniae]MBO1324790.1 hypothetical protein [Acetobacter garciniae]MBX0344481.1 hypothetical protein [Acetobacter garciniae]